MFVTAHPFSTFSLHHVVYISDQKRAPWNSEPIDMFMPPVAIAFYTVLEGLRNRLLWLLALFVIAGFALTEFIGELAITETVQFQSALLGSYFRLCGVFMVSLFVVTSMVREFDEKGLELVLSLPVTRVQYYIGKLVGFCVLALSTGIIFSMCLLLYAPPLQVLLWGSSLGCELLIITAFSLLCLFTFNQVPLALSAVMGFYVLSRTIGAFQLMAAGSMMNTDTLSQQVITVLIDGIAFVLPELQRFASTEWLVYHTGRWEALLPIVGQSLIYISLLAGASLFDLYRKNI